MRFFSPADALESGSVLPGRQQPAFANPGLAEHVPIILHSSAELFVVWVKIPENRLGNRFVNSVCSFKRNSL